MPKVITVHLPAETHLVVCADAFSPVTISRKDASPSSFVQLVDRNTEVALGPFSDERDFTLTSDTAGFTYNIDEVDKLAYNHQSTGSFEGGAISISADTTLFDIAAGKGIVVDNYTDPDTPKLRTVEWPALIGIEVENILTNDFSYISIDKTGCVIQQTTVLTGPDRRNLISIGIISHSDNVNVEVAITRPLPAYDQAHAFIDMADTFGVMNKTGNIFTSSGANLKLDRTSGSSYRLGHNWNNSSQSPNITNDVSATEVLMFNQIRDGLGGFTPVTIETELDPDHYDDGSGTLALVPASDPIQIVRLYFVPDLGGHSFAYGRQLYKTIAAAQANIAAEVFEVPVLDLEISLRGYVLLRRGTTDLTDPTNAKFIEANRFGDAPGSGTTSGATTLQLAYENSETPEIVTNATEGPVCIKEGTGDSSAKCFIILDNDDVEILSVAGNGEISVGIINGLTAARPASPVDYQMYFDTTLGKPIWYDGTNWVDSTGSTV